jgi:hypothetical protein
MGIANIVEAAVEATLPDRVRLRWAGLPIDAAPSRRWPAAGSVAIGLRPERLVLQNAIAGGNAVRGIVRSIIYQGAFTSLEIEPVHAAGARLKLRSPGLPPEHARLAVGDTVSVGFAADAVIPLHAEETPATLPAAAVA